MSTPAAAEQFRLLKIGCESGLVLSSAGRVVRVNAPDCPRGPRLHFSGCAGGNLFYLRDDVAEPLASELLAIASRESAWHDCDVTPGCLPDLVACLATAEPVKTVELSVQHRLPNMLHYRHDTEIVCSDTPEGDKLQAAFAEKGLPKPMRDAGFLTVEDLWKPWCIAREGDQVASIAFAARLGKTGAAIGVYTFPGYRGRGFAAAVTARWSQLPELQDTVLFYGARKDNMSSRRVIERLSLPQIGAGFTIA